MPYRRQDDNRGTIGTLQTEAIGVLEENMALAVRCSKELENYIVDCRAPQVVFQLGARRKSRMMRRGIQSGGRKSEECRVSHKTTGLSHKSSLLFTRASSCFLKNAFTLHPLAIEPYGRARRAESR